MKLRKPLRRLWMALGFKPYFLSCPSSQMHDWRETHGDERMAVGDRYLCRNCPRTTSVLIERYDASQHVGPREAMALAEPKEISR